MTVTGDPTARPNPSGTLLRGYAAVDLGASSGRVMLGLVGGESVVIEEMHRFANEPLQAGDEMVWDLPLLFQETLRGLQASAHRCAQLQAEFAGIGVDSWGVDWAYLSPDGVVELPSRHYRDAPDPAPALANRALAPDEVYRISGIADQAINSALRMAVDASSRRFAGEIPLFTPDVWVHWLTGDIGTDPTIASTSQLLDARSAEFSEELISAAGLQGLDMPPVRPVGSRAGITSPEATERLGAIRPVPVFRVAGHDTACAFAFATPGDAEQDALVSSGTWSLVGTVRDEPLTSESAFALGLTNEQGASGVLLLRNLTGLWMLQECEREWSARGDRPLSELLDEAARAPSDDRVFDTSDARLFGAGGMEARIRQLCAEIRRPLDDGQVSVVRAILDSLAAAYATSVDLLADETETTFQRIRIVGGGSSNDLLCQRTADLSGLPVIAGPSEATAIGNIAIQACADGAISDITDLYARLGGDEAPRTFHPRIQEDPRI